MVRQSARLRSGEPFETKSGGGCRGTSGRPERCVFGSSDGTRVLERAVQWRARRRQHDFGNGARF